MKDRTRLARIVLVKQRERDQRKAEMARAAERVRAAEDEVARLAQARERLSRQLAMPGTHSARDLMSGATVLAHTRHALAAAHERVAEQKKHHAREAARVAQSARDLAALDKVRERLRAQDAEKVERVEQNLMDDAARRRAS